MSRRSSRRETRLIDSLITTDERDGTSDALWKGFANRSRKNEVTDLFRLWPSIARKGEALVYREFLRKQHGEKLRPLRVVDKLTEEESAALFVIASRLMETRTTDSTLRDERDRLIAADYVFHNEILQHTAYVLPKLCDRWDVSEHIAKKAISRQRAAARLYVANRLQAHGLWIQLARENPQLFAERIDATVGPSDTAETMMQRELRQQASAYRAAGSRARPRTRGKRRD